MVSFFNFINRNNKKQKGITLIELLVVIFIVVLFSIIGISDFPKILRAYALSRATYKMSQDFRKVQDWGLSGVALIKDNYECTVPVKGYGIYIDMAHPKRYIIYADVSDTLGAYDKKFTDASYTKCEDKNYYNLGGCLTRSGSEVGDCVIEIVDLNDENPSLYINDIAGTNMTTASINFNPPAPDTTIFTGYNPEPTSIGIEIRNTENLQRSVWVNKSGLIEVKAE